MSLEDKITSLEQERDQLTHILKQQDGELQQLGKDDSLVRELE
jgi:hypothetical protein